MLAVLTKLQYLDNLIKKKATGDPTNLARKLKVTERSVYNYLKILKELGAPVKFCHPSNSYIYEYDGELTIKFISNEMLLHLINTE